MRVSDEYHPFLQKMVGMHCIAASPPYFVPTDIKSSVDRAAKLNGKKDSTKDAQTVCSLRIALLRYCFCFEQSMILTG